MISTWTQDWNKKEKNSRLLYASLGCRNEESGIGGIEHRSIKCCIFSTNLKETFSSTRRIPRAAVAFMILRDEATMYVPEKNETE